MNFYVYEWFNTKTKEVFYVGKGCKDRYKDKNNRNKFFLEYIKNNEVDVRIIKYFEEEQEAFDFEEKTIEYYKNKGMCSCNLMSGGYGGYSKVWTSEMKKYISIYNPMKEEKQKKRMSENNPMKNHELALKVNSKNKRKVVINNKTFDSVKEAADFYKVAPQTVSNWCKRGYNTKGEKSRYFEEKQKEFIFKKTNSCGVFIDEKYYDSLKAAAKALGANDSSPLCKALKNNKTYKGHTCRYANQQPS